MRDEIDLDDNTLWKDFEDRDLAPGVNMKKIRKEFNNAESIKILITGKTGTGKSTLTNGIIGCKVEEDGDELESSEPKENDEPKKAKESADLHQRGTIELTEFETKIGKVSVKVWDSPGLQDCTRNQAGYLKQMKQICSERDLTLYCIKATETRIVRGTDNPDVVAMDKLTKTFTVDFWKNAIIVLTFANELQYKVRYMKAPPEKKVEAQNKILQEWDKQLRIILSEDIKIPEEIVEKN